jgi:hypothetical protein
VYCTCITTLSHELNNVGQPALCAVISVPATEEVKDMLGFFVMLYVVNRDEKGL